MKLLDDAQRAAVVQGWLELSRAAPCQAARKTQREYAKEHGLSERTLRHYVLRLAGRPQRQREVERLLEAEQLLADMVALSQRVERLQDQVRDLRAQVEGKPGPAARQHETSAPEEGDHESGDACRSASVTLPPELAVGAGGGSMGSSDPSQSSPTHPASEAKPAAETGPSRVATAQLGSKKKRGAFDFDFDFGS